MRLFSLHIWFVDRPTEHDNGSGLSSVQVTHGKSLRTLVICSSPGSAACHFLTHSAFSANTFPTCPQNCGGGKRYSPVSQVEVVWSVWRDCQWTWVTPTTWGNLGHSNNQPAHYHIMADAKTQKLMEDLGLKKKDIDGLCDSHHKQHFCS